MGIDLNKVNKVDTDLVLPSIDDNLIETQKNKWGKILNEQTFKLLNNNIKILKDSLTETINTINNENIFAKNKFINEENNIISLGENTKKLNFLTTQIQLNGVDTEFLTSNSLENIPNVAYLNKSNNFTEPINSTQYKLNNNSIISDDNTNINVGSNGRKINLQSSDGKLYINNKEFSIPKTLEDKFFTFEELKNYDNRISNFLVDCIIFTQGKLGVISGYFRDDTRMFEMLNSSVEMFKVPIKIKHYKKSETFSDIWLNENMLIRRYSNWDYSVIRMGGYFEINKKNRAFHFQGVFCIE